MAQARNAVTGRTVSGHEEALARLAHPWELVKESVKDEKPAPRKRTPRKKKS